MHLHGAFYQVLSQGTFETNTAYADGDRQSVVTQNLQPGSTMMMEWTPEHAGRWLFHCHFQFHVSTDERVPVFSRVMAEQYGESEPANGAHAHPEAMGRHHERHGRTGAHDQRESTVVSAAAHLGSYAAKNRSCDRVRCGWRKSRTFSCSVREGKKIVASEDKSVGPPIVVTRGEPTEITVVNHLDVPTTIHWHGLELDSYYDGVVGGGTGNQITPAIQPGASFGRPLHAQSCRTFIYHSHTADPNQLSGGVYGGLIVLEPGESFGAEHDRLLVIGTRDTFFDAKRITVNGSEVLSPMLFNRSATYRLRVINMAPNFVADVQLGSNEHPGRWRALGKDGARLPVATGESGDALLHIASGETYDFEFRPDTPGEIPWQIENSINKSKLVGKIVVQ